MNETAPLRKKFEHLRRRPGPRGWQSRAADDLGYSRGYISRLVHGTAKSPAAEAALKEWRKTHKVA